MEVVLNNTLAGLKRGVDTLGDAVSVTMGPKGRNVVIVKNGQKPLVTKDGVTVAEAIEDLDDTLENIGAQMIKEVATLAGKISGDGTTTATVLAQAIVSEGFKNIAAGANPIDLKRGMDKAVVEVVKYLKDNSTQIELDGPEVRQVAAISANNDPELGDMLAEAFTKVGKQGVVSVELSPNHNTYIEVVTGMQFDRGYVSPLFPTNQEGTVSELENPMFLLCDKKINNMDDIIPVMTLAKKTGRPLVVIAEDVDGQALSQLVVNKVHKSLLSVAIKAPGFSESRFENLTDIAVLTNSVVFSDSTGFTLEALTDDNISEEMFGGAEGITVERTSTVIVNGRGDDNVILDRVGQLTRKVEESSSEHEAKQLRSRIAKLSGGVAVVYVGASSPTEAKEKKDRADDALCAVRAAIEEGIVDGGGSALLRARSAITLLMGDENVGAQIIKEAIARPVKIISENAGKSGDVTLADVGALEEGWGYNAKLDRYAIMKDEGVIDPLKVTRVALESANSAAGMILLTECAIF